MKQKQSLAANNPRHATGFRRSPVAMILAIAVAALAAAGCGGGDSNTDACVKNPWACGTPSQTTTISGAVTVPFGTPLTRTGGEPRSGAALSESAVPSPVIQIGRLKSNGLIENLDGITYTSDANGNYTARGVLPVENNLVVIASKAGATATTQVRSFFSVRTTDVGTTKTATNIDTIGTFTVEAVRQIILAETQGKAAKDISTTDLATLKSYIAADLPALIPAKVSVTDVMRNGASLQTQFSNLVNNSSQIASLVNTMSNNGVDTAAPIVLRFSPANNATNVPYDGTTFKVIFNESMNATVDLNNQTVLTASGFSLKITRSDNGATITINANNALVYGSFAWSADTAPNDTLAYTLKSNAVLQANGLRTLKPYKTFTITSITVPTNLKDAANNPLSTVGIPTAGSFMTAP